MPDPGMMPRSTNALVRSALDEDLAGGDVTTLAIVDEAATCRAELVFRSGGVVAGVPLARAVFALLDGDGVFEQLVAEGERAGRGAVVARFEGRARAALSAERTALNFVSHLSGIATLTARFVEAVAGTCAAILDTRKTTPLLREFQKYAVRAGGGVNHRMNLADAVLIKDNHLAVTGLSPAEAVRRARARLATSVEVEVETLDDALAAARAGADVVMLDNFSPAAAAEAVAAVRGEFPSRRSGSPAIEISGGVTLDNVRAFAEAGADRISIGALTHSAAGVDVSLDVSARAR